MNEQEYNELETVAKFSKDCEFFETFLRGAIRLRNYSPRIIASVFCEILSSTLALQDNPKDAMEQFISLLKERTDEKRASP